MTGQGSLSSRVGFENIVPILSVRDLAASIEYYTRVLGFGVEWQDIAMVSVSRDGRAIMLCEGAQGSPGTWVWIGVEDAAAIFEEYRSRGAIIRQDLTNYPWALEARIADPDGHILRLGSEPLSDQPYAQG